MRSVRAMRTRWFDLTRTFGPSASVPKHVRGANPPSITTVTAKRFRVGKEEFLLHKQEVKFATHSGTHLDAFSHFIDGSQTIDAIPLEKLFGTGVVLGVAGKPSRPLSVADLDESSPAVRKEDIVSIHTGWDEKYGTDEYYSHPYLAEEAALWLAESRVKLVGIDTPTPEVPRSVCRASFDYPIHRTLLGNGVLILENVANLYALSGRRLTIGVFPVKLEGGDGAPARVVARL